MAKYGVCITIAIEPRCFVTTILRIPTKQIDRSQILPNIAQTACVSEIRKLDVQVTGDPLLIPKQEMDQIPLSTTAAEVFIEALSPSRGSRSKDQQLEPMEVKRTRSAIKKTKYKRRNKKKTHNTRAVKKHNINGNLSGTFACSICDDVCANELEFKNHLDFHMELHKGSDKDSNVGEIHERLSLPKQLAPMISSSSLSKRNPKLLSITRTQNPDRSNITKEVSIVPLSSKTDSQTLLPVTKIGEPSSSSTRRVGVKTRKAKSLSASASAIFEANKPQRNSSTYEIVNMDSSSKNGTQPLKDIVDSGVSTETKIVVDDPSSTSAILVRVKTRSSKLPKKVKPETKKSIKKSLAVGCRNLPEIPVLKCECPLKKLQDNKCEVCSENAKYLCVNCNIEFNSHPQLMEHFAAEHAKLTFFCQECGHGHLRIETLIRHQDRHKGLIPCYRCISSFKTKQELEEHLWTHKIKCDQCDKTCSNDDDLRTHKLEDHKGMTYTCKECSKTFNKYSIMRAHITRHHRTGNFVCKTCGKEYHRLVSYYRHVNRHNQEKQVICEECGKEFGSVMYLKRHRQAVHLKKKHVCDVCKKEFATFKSRITCEDKHAGIARYKCDMCEKAFFHHMSLVIHRRIHTGEKPYLCFVCSRRFYSPQMLIKHALSHGLLETDIKQRMKSAYQPEKE